MYIHTNLVHKQNKTSLSLSGIWRLKYTYICNQVTKNTPYWPIFYNTGTSMHYYVLLVILSEFTSQGTVRCLQCFTQAVDGITATVTQPWYTHVYRTDEHCNVNVFLQGTTPSDRIHRSAVLHCNTRKSGQSWLAC